MGLGNLLQDFQQRLALAEIGLGEVVIEVPAHVVGVEFRGLFELSGENPAVQRAEGHDADAVVPGGLVHELAFPGKQRIPGLDKVHPGIDVGLVGVEHGGLFQQVEVEVGNAQVFELPFRFQLRQDLEGHFQGRFRVGLMDEIDVDIVGVQPL